VAVTARGITGASIVLAGVLGGLILGACTPLGSDGLPRHNPRYDANAPNQKQQETLFGNGGLTALFGDKEKTDGSGSGVAVNSFLWRASLDTISFMPLAQADPFGGVIITDWYTPPDTPNERFKINVYILDRQLRSDGIRATVFRQRLDPGGQWTEVPVDRATATELENAILTRARQMRVAQLG
jgi:hypothetical protein